MYRRLLRSVGGERMTKYLLEHRQTTTTRQRYEVEAVTPHQAKMLVAYSRHHLTPTGPSEKSTDEHVSLCVTPIQTDSGAAPVRLTDGRRAEIIRYGGDNHYHAVIRQCGRERLPVARVTIRRDGERWEVVRQSRMEARS
jgi:hypothetical protein